MSYNPNSKELKFDAQTSFTGNVLNNCIYCLAMFYSRMLFLYGTLKANQKLVGVIGATSSAGCPISVVCIHEVVTGIILSENKANYSLHRWGVEAKSCCENYLLSTCLDVYMSL